MNWWWFIGAIVVWLASAGCIIGTVVEWFVGKAGLRKGDTWGGIAFHGATAILALWLFLKAIGKA